MSRAFIIGKESFFALICIRRPSGEQYTKVSGDNFCADIGIISYYSNTIYLNADALGCLNQ